MIPESEDACFLENGQKNNFALLNQDKKKNQLDGSWTHEESSIGNNKQSYDHEAKLYPLLNQPEANGDHLKKTNGVFGNLSNMTIRSTVTGSKENMSEESCKGLLGGSKVSNGGAKIVAPHGDVPKGESNGHHCITGGRLISCARVKWTPLLCWQQSSKKPSYYTLFFLLILFIISLIGTIIFCFTNVFATTVLSNIIITKNSSSYHLWKDPPVHPFMRVHLFNYTNIDDIMNGNATKFKVQDVGPYVYQQTIKRVNVGFNKNGTVTYQETSLFEFISEMSVGSQYDKVIVPNLPLLSAISMVKDSYYITQMGLSTVFQTLKTQPFRLLPVHRFLWGYEDELISLARPFLSLRGDMPYKEFGILVTKNGTSRDRITIYTGEDDLDKIGIIEKYNGEDKIAHWGTDECNRLDATDGTIFPASLLDEKQTLYIYNKELCRRFPFVFQEKVEVFNKITALRYSPPANVFDHPSTNPANQCFCHMDSAVCPPKGLFNSSPCAFGAPAFASFPHFYLGDPELLNTIDGLKPIPEEHSSYLDIHPTLGLPLAGSSKMQINIQIRKSQGINGFDYLPDELILPIAWLDVSLTELPQEIRTMVYHGTFSAHQIHLILMWGFGLGLIISGFFLTLAVKARWSKDTMKV